MLGAIAGDIIGSRYEFQPIKSEEFPLFGADCAFTDDSVLTVATADAVLTGRDYAAAYRNWGARYPERSYGSLFRQWLRADHPEPYGSYGNGSAMRVAPVGFAGTSLDQVLREAARSARVTHNHPEGVKGAQAVAACVFLARRGASKAELRSFVCGRFGYGLDRPLAEIRPSYRFDETCSGSVPEALSAFLESRDYEDAVRKAVSLGGDADTQAAIAGAVAEAFYGGVPEPIWNRTLGYLTCEMGTLVARFYAELDLPHGWAPRVGRPPRSRAA